MCSILKIYSELYYINACNFKLDINKRLNASLKDLLLSGALRILVFSPTNKNEHETGQTPISRSPDF